MTALGHLAEHYADAEQVVGKTAGSVAAAPYGGLVGDRLPDAEVTVFGAQSGAWPDNPDLNTGVLDARWGAYDAVPDWAVEGLGGACRCSGSRPAGTTPTSSWPASTSPSTHTRPAR